MRGDPKPLLDEDLTGVLRRLEAWFAAHLPPGYRLNPPASDTQLAEVEQLVGFDLPAAWRQLYGWHDGEPADSEGHVYGLRLLPLAEVAAQWTGWRDVLDDFDGDRYVSDGGAWPEDAVDSAYINPRWLPLTHDHSGNHIGLDFDPRPEGRVGQVILFGRDEAMKVVLASSLGQFLEWIARLLESGNFAFEAPSGDPEASGFQLREPPNRHFHDGARELLGAPGPGC